MIDPAEPDIAAARIEITNQSSGATMISTTGADGGYLVSVAPGEYQVTLDLSSVGSRLTTVGSYTVTLAGGEQRLELNFGIVHDSAPGGSAGVAFTGTIAGQLALVAGALLVAGIGFLLFERRIRQCAPLGHRRTD